MNEAAYSFVAGPAQAGQRLDRALVERIEGMSRASARAMTAEGRVRVNGRVARKAERLAEGDRVELEVLPEAVDFSPDAEPDVALAVVYEDASLVVVDKPAGMPTHPLRAGERGSLAAALLARYPEMSEVGYARREPGVLHRLDVGTSGLLLAARDPQTFEALRAALRSGSIDKRYRALCAGHLEPGLVIDQPIDPGRGRRVRVGAGSPWAARTEVLSVERHGPASLVEVRARVAGRHQVRAHLAWAGHPLYGDALYGGPSVAGHTYHFLHASRLRFVHRGAWLELEAELPPTWGAFLQALARQEDQR